VLGAAITQIVAVDAGNDHIFELERGDRFAEFARLVRVGRQRLAVADVAERAAAGADVAEDHEGGGAAPEAFADVGAGGFFADGVQLAFAQHGLDLAEAPGAVAGLDANPVRLCFSGLSTGTILIGMRAVFSSPFCLPFCFALPTLSAMLFVQLQQQVLRELLAGLVAVSVH
jgi:hypothetical protein